MNHKVLQQGFRTVVAGVLLVAGSQAMAAKYIVTFKDQKAFGQIHAQYVLSSQLNLSQVAIGAQGMPLAVGQMDVEESLRPLKAMIVETSDEKAIEALAQSGLVDFVEPEIFHPAPMPIQGFQPWKPWNVSLATQVLDEDVDGRRQAANRTPWGIKTVRAREAWAQSHSGQGARVLILDTGLDTNHPAFVGNFEAGRDFTGADGSTDITDQVGHGTHVAGTVLGVLMTDGFSGVAPKAKLLAGRVCAADGCSNLAVAKGIAWGIEQKVDVISMSLGGPIGSMAEKRAAEAADAAGVVVVAATGNDGTGKVCFPAAFPSVVAVGATDSTNKRATFSQYGPELDVVAPGVGVNSSVPMGSGRESSVKLKLGSGTVEEIKSTTFVGTVEVTSPMTNTLVVSGLGHPADFTTEVQGKFALISRGEISFGDKARNAIAAGAAGVIIYNNVPGLLQGALTTDGSVLQIPVMMIEQTVGESLRASLQAGGEASVTVQTMATDYSAFDGTSMATPHVSGVVALVKAANPKLTPAQVRSILAETSTNVGPLSEYGAGLVNAEAAVNKALLTK